MSERQENPGARDDRVASLVNLARRVRPEEFVGDVEVARQFKVRPMVERIAQRLGHDFRVAREFFPSEASPVQKRSVHPAARMARHL